MGGLRGANLGNPDSARISSDMSQGGSSSSASLLLLLLLLLDSQRVVGPWLKVRELEREWVRERWKTVRDLPE